MASAVSGLVINASSAFEGETDVPGEPGYFHFPNADIVLSCR